MSDKKPLWKSKTIWVALLTIWLGALESRGTLDLVSEDMQPLLLVGIGALNGLLRVLTTQGVRVL